MSAQMCRTPDRKRPEGKFASKTVFGNCEFCPRHATKWVRGGADEIACACCAACFHLMKTYDPNTPWPRNEKRCGERR